MIINTIKYIIVLQFVITTNLTFGMDKVHFFTEANAFFNKYVESGLVKYSQIKNDETNIIDLVAYIGSADISTFSNNEKLAFYINAYNLLVINQILIKYPVKSPMDLAGFFDGKKHLIASKKLTLNSLENNKIRTYKDPRIHFVLVCAAMSCPKIGNFAYTPDNLETQLTKQTKLALNDSEFVILDGNKVKISEIFSWYRQDFGKSDKDLINFINKYRDSDLPEKTKLSYYTYDWALNDLIKQ